MSIWNDLFVIQTPVLEKVLRTVIVYAVLLVLFRLAGKRGLASLNSFDLAVVFLLSNVVQNAVIGSDNSLLGGILGAATLVAVNAGLNRLSVQYPRVATLFEGTPTTVIEEGRLDERALRHLSIRPAELEFAVKLQNGDAVRDIQDGRLDPGGHLVLTLKPPQRTATQGDLASLADRLATIEQLLPERQNDERHC
jgi:uncharacterized membrane protein YcaP (DUF421 family)